MERHLWLNLSQIKDKDRAFLLNDPISPSGLFGGAVKFSRRQVSRDLKLGLIGGVSPNRVQAPHIEKSKNGLQAEVKRGDGSEDRHLQ